MDIACGSLSQFVSDAPTAMAMFDREMRYLAASPRWLAFMGLEQTPVGRIHCEDIPDGNGAWRASFQRCLAGAVETSGGQRLRRPDGRDRWVGYEVRPWRTEDGAIGGLVITGEDVTLRIEAEQRAEEAERRLEESARRAETAERRLIDAVEIIPGGFLIYDADDRLVVCNEATREMYPAIADVLRPGASFNQILRVGLDRGHGPVEPEKQDDWLLERKERRRNPFGAIVQLTVAGRWVRIEERRTSEGGLVALRTDITDLKKREHELDHKTVFLEAILENMGEGIAVFGPNRKLLMWNDIAAQLLQAPELARIGTDFEDVVRLRAAHGDFGDVDVEARVRDAVALFRAGRPWSRTERRPNGLTIEVRFHPLPDGGAVYVLRDVTERADAEAQLAEKTALLEAALENMGEGFSVYGPDLRLVIRSKVSVEILELPLAPLLPGTPFEDVMRFRAERGDFGEGDVESLVAFRVARFRAQRPWSQTQRDRHGRAIELRFNPTPAGGGVFMFRDVTERADAEAKLAERTALLEATLHNMGEGIVVYDSDRKMLMSNEIAAKVLEMPAALCEVGASLEEHIRFRVARGDFGDLDPETAVREGVGRFRKQQRWDWVHAVVDGRVIETRFSPSPDGGGIFLIRDVTERAEQEAKLAEKTALLETVLENIGEGIAVYGPDMRLRMSNEVMAEALGTPPGLLKPGVSREDVVRFRAARGDFGQVDVEEAVRERVARFHAQRPVSFVRSMHDGRRVEAHFRPMPDGGGLFVLHDVTERERNEARIREEEAKFRSLVEQDVAGIVIVGDDGTIGYCNGCFAHMIGYAAGELVGRPLLDFVPEDERPAIVRRLSGHLFETGAATQIASTVRARNGSVIEVLVNASRSTVEGRPASIAVVLDVTARNRAQRALASAAAILAAVHESSPDGILVVDPGARILSANKRFGEIMGVSCEVLAAGDDWAVLAIVAQRMLDGEAFLRGVQYYHEHLEELVHDELQLVDGRVLDRISSPLKTADGENLGRIWFFRDVSDRRKAEASLRASEERFRMLIEEAPDAILLLDFDQNRFVAANKAAERLFGVSRNLILEQGPRRFYTSNQPDGRPVPESVVEHDERALAGEEVKFERRIRRPSGEERLTRVTLVRLASNARLLRASFVDVTDQMAAEAKLSEVLRNLVDRQEQDRQRIARELHDSLGQYLAAMNIKLETFNQSLSSSSPLRSGVADLKSLTGTIGNEVNRLAWEMRPTALDDIGLGPAIQQFLDEWADRSGMRIDVHLTLKDRRMPANVETTLYRVLQEGITNIVKHASAGRVGVIVKESASDVVMIIEDDGVGFDLETLNRASPRLGLLGMRERLAAVHGGLEVETRPGEGTTLITRVILDGSADSRH